MAEKENKKKGGIVPFGSEFERMFDNMLREMREFDFPFGLRRWHRPLWGVPPKFFDMFEEFGRIAEPAVDVVDKGDRFEVTADIPGIPKENLEVNVTDDEIEIKGNFEEKKKEEGKTYLQRERRATSVYRRVSLPAEVISDKASAKIDGGILKISLPKKKPTEEQKPRKIKIE